MIRLGGWVDCGDTKDPETIARIHQEFGYTAAYGPEVSLSEKAYIKAFREAFAARDIVIAEVGIWRNLLAHEEDTRKANFDFACERFALADEVGALCCVNFIGSVAPDQRRGPDPDNLSQRGFDRCVLMIQKLIDAVKPKHAKFCLEMMQFLLPDSAEVYLDIVKAVDRSAFGVHLDPVNIIFSPRQYFDNGQLIRHCFELLTPWLASCHAKDILLEDRLALHFNEIMPGQGNLDYAAYLSALAAIPREIPLMLEHLKPEEYAGGRDHIEAVAKREKIDLYRCCKAPASAR